MVENKLTVVPPVEPANECFAMIFDSDLDAKTLTNIRAVVALGKLTREQYCRVPGEFNRVYTETNAVKKYVNFILEQSEYAHILSTLPKNVVYCTRADISERLKDLPNDLHWMVDMVALVDAIKENTAVGREILAAIKENTAVRENNVFEGTLLIIVWRN